jgi:hypothetical protein
VQKHQHLARGSVLLVAEIVRDVVVLLVTVAKWTYSPDVVFVIAYCTRTYKYYWTISLDFAVVEAYFHLDLLMPLVYFTRCFRSY